jgi:imidazolonepropionase-like amidohydrolase
MRLVTLLVALLLSACSGGSGSPSLSGTSDEASPLSVANYALLNGRWFDGKGFESATWYSVQGRLTRKAPPGRLEKIDLSGLFVVPPFGEAHNHNVGGPWDVDEVVRRYLKDGVYYVKIPGNIAEFTNAIRPRINRPTSIDVIFSNGGLTATGGHPAPLYEEVLAVTRYAQVLGPVEKGWFNNRAYVTIDNEVDLSRKWSLITADKPDFLKTFLAHSEEFDDRRGRSSPTVHAGLNPDLLPLIVAEAHRAGLRVSTHVETAYDFRQAVRAGVDEITHLPGWWVPEPEDLPAARLTEQDAERAAAAGVVVVTTTVAGQMMPGHSRHASPDPHQKTMPGSTPALPHQAEGAEAARALQRDNLRLLRQHHVPLAIGSDHAETSLAEVLNLRSLGLFDNLTLLNLWCEATPRAIFPDRKIGRFEEGYEASFLALGGNPLDDFMQVQTITRRFKQGVPLDQDGSAGLGDSKAAPALR